MKQKRFASAAAVLLFAQYAAAIPVPHAAAAEQYLIRDKWGYCQTAHYAESEHFVIFYGNHDTTGEVSDAFLKRNLASCEILWKCYSEYLGMENFNTDIYGKSQQKYKTNIYLTETGLPQFESGWAFMSSEDGYGMEIISPKALLDDLTLAHEFGHVVTYQQKAWVDQEITGAWWESLANWFREMYLMSDYYTGSTKTCWFEPYLRNMSLTLPHGRNYYETWPFLVYLSYDPDQIGTGGISAVKRMISEAKPAEYPLDTAARLFDTDVQTLLGNYAKRMAVFDLGAKDAYREEFRKKLSDAPYFWNLFYTVPELSAGGMLRVPQEEAPMQGGINIIPLDVSSDTVTVTFRGLSDDPNADWRACIVTPDASGAPQYSPLFTDGDTVTVHVDNTKKAYLTVTAAPKKPVHVNAFHKEQDSAYRTGSERRRYPYAFSLSGAFVQQSANPAKGKGHIHANGGGWVSDSASVADSVYVAPDAMVLGSAKLSGNVRVEDHAIIANDVTAKDHAVISGHAFVSGGGWAYVNNSWQPGAVTLSGNAVITDSAVVSVGCSISGNAKVCGKAFLTDAVTLSDHAVAGGMAYLTGSGKYSGSAVLDGDYANEQTLTSGVHFGWQDDSYRPADPGTFTASYDFSDAGSFWAKDRYTATQAAMQDAVLAAERTSAKDVAVLNGSGFIELDDALFRTDGIQISTAVLRKSAVPGQTLLQIGDETAYLSLTPENAAGKAEIVLTDGKTTEKITADTAIQKDVWQKITVQLFDGSCTMLIDGRKAASGTVTLTPNSILSAAGTDSAYFGNGSNGIGFRGAVDYINLYSSITPEPDNRYSGTEEPENSPLRGDIDLNGAVNAADAVLLQKYLLCSTAFAKANFAAADLDGSKSVTAADLSYLKQMLLR